MAVLTADSSVRYTGRGDTGPYAITFPVRLDANGNAQDVKVYLQDTLGVETEITSLCTVTGLNVYTTTAYASTHIVALARDPALTQPDTWEQGGKFPAKRFEYALDRIVYMIQNLSLFITGGLRRAITDSQTEDMTIPLKDARAGKFLAFDASGEPIPAEGSAAPVTPFMATVLDDETADVALGTLGVSSFVRGIRADADAPARLTSLGVSTFMQSVLDDVTALAARSTLGVIVKGRVATRDDLPTSGVSDGDVWFVDDGSPVSGNHFMYKSGHFGEYGGWCGIDRPKIGMGTVSSKRAGNWSDTWTWNNRGFSPTSDDLCYITGVQVIMNGSTTVSSFFVDPTGSINVSGVRSLAVRDDLCAWPKASAFTPGSNSLVYALVAYGRVVYVCEGILGDNVSLQMTVGTTNHVYMSGNLFVQAPSGTLVDFTASTRIFYIGKYKLHLTGGSTLEAAINLGAGTLNNQTPGGLIVLRGKLGLTPAGVDLEDVHVKDLGGATYIKQYQNTTVGDLVIDAGCTWDRNGFTLTYDNLVNNGTLI